MSLEKIWLRLLPYLLAMDKILENTWLSAFGGVTSLEKVQLWSRPTNPSNTSCAVKGESGSPCLTNIAEFKLVKFLFKNWPCVTSVYVKGLGKYITENFSHILTLSIGFSVSVSVSVLSSLFVPLSQSLSLYFCLTLSHIQKEKNWR